MKPVRYSTEMRWAALMAGVGALAAAGCWAALPAAAAQSPLALLAAWAGLMAAGLFAGVGALRVLDRRPALILDAHGVRDRRMGVAAAWGEILAARLLPREGPGRPAYIALQVLDPARVRLPGAPDPGGDVLLRIDGLRAQGPAILAAMERIRPGIARDGIARGGEM